MKRLIDLICMIITAPFAVAASLLIGILLAVVMLPVLLFICLVLLFVALITILSAMISVIFWILTGKDLL